MDVSSLVDPSPGGNPPAGSIPLSSMMMSGSLAHPFLPTATTRTATGNPTNAMSQPTLGGSSSTNRTGMANERQVIRFAGRQAICQFLESHTCFAVVRISGKVVVFDVRIPIQLAFYALVEHDMQAAPLWDSVSCQFVGLLTVCDFIDLLRVYKATGRDVAALATTSIADILAAQRNEQPPSPPHFSSSSSLAKAVAVGTPSPSASTFFGVDSTCSLHRACQLLLSLKGQQDYLPVVYADDMRVLACITYTTILEHLVTHFREQRRLFDDSIADLGIGTYHNPDKNTTVVSVLAHQSLATALEIMSQHQLSAVPVISADGQSKIVGVYARSDITFLTKAMDAEDAVANLHQPLSEILAQQRTDVTTPDAVRTCYPTHTLQAIFESFATTRFNRLYVIDTNETLIGVVSARDLVEYFLGGGQS